MCTFEEYNVLYIIARIGYYVHNYVINRLFHALVKNMGFPTPASRRAKNKDVVRNVTFISEAGECDNVNWYYICTM